MFAADYHWNYFITEQYCRKNEYSSTDTFFCRKCLQSRLNPIQIIFILSNLPILWVFTQILLKPHGFRGPRLSLYAACFLHHLIGGYRHPTAFSNLSIVRFAVNATRSTHEPNACCLNPILRACQCNVMCHQIRTFQVNGGQWWANNYNVAFSDNKLTVW